MKQREEAVDIACQNGDLRIIELLVEAGAMVNIMEAPVETSRLSRYLHPLENAAQHGHEDIVDYLLGLSTMGDNLLQVLIKFLLFSICRFIVCHAQVSKGFLSACNGRHLGVAQMLLERGADVNYSSPALV
jgi:hypothetical protein